MSTLSLAKELQRRKAAQDDNYYRNLTYFFELQVPAHAAATQGDTSFVFPILLPTGYTMTEPFAIEKTYGQGGSLIVEENGIVERMINIKGTTGFRPRRVKGNYMRALDVVTKESKSHGRVLPTHISVNELSGQRHFQYLQDVVIRTYGDLKRDPATAEGTRLLFHNPKDQEHWEVKPEKFELDRQADGMGRVSYPYEIQLLVVGPAEDVEKDFSEDKPLMQAMGDKIRMLSSGLDMVSGAVNDLNALRAELTNLFRGLDNVLDAAVTIVTAVNSFVEGTTDSVQLPAKMITSTLDDLDAAIEANDDLVTGGVAPSEATADDPPTDVADIPLSVRNKLDVLSDGLERIGTHPAAFETPTQKAMREIKDRQEILTHASQEELDTARATAAPTTLEEVDALGSTLTAGEVKIAEGDLGVGREVQQYTGSRAITVEQGDTLVSLAARYLNDARLWQHIAVLNNMKPPFANDLADAPVLNLDESPLAGAVSVGDTLLIPNFSRPPSGQALIPVLGASLDASAEDQLLGTDMLLERISGNDSSPLFGWVVDKDGGSLDARHVSGVANLGQGLTERMRVEEGTDLLFKRLGLRRVVGVNNLGVDLEMVRFRIIQSLQQDGRVSTVRSVEFDGSQSDALGTDVVVEIRGLNEGTTVNATV